MASASEEVWVLGINMTKFGKHPTSTPPTWHHRRSRRPGRRRVAMKDMGIIGAGNLMGGALPIGQVVQKQLGQTGIPSTTSPTPAPPAHRAACGGHGD